MGKTANDHEVTVNGETHVTAFPVTPDIASTNNAPVKEIIEFIENPSEGKIGTDEHLEKCVLHIGKIFDVYARGDDSLRERGTAIAINLGILLNSLKKVVRSAFKDWEPWAADHFPKISARSRQNYMLIAKHAYSHKYAELGLERLLYLIKVSKNIKNSDPLGYLIGKYSISKPDPDESLDEFKKRIDAAIFVQTTEKAGVTVKYNTIFDLINVKRRLDNKLIITLNTLQNNKGDVEGYLNKLILNGGVDENPMPQDNSSISADKAIAQLTMILKHLMDENMEYEFDDDSPIHNFKEVYANFLQYIEYPTDEGIV